MFQWFAIALPHVKAGNTSEKLLSKIRQIIIFLVSSKRNYLKSI